MSKDGGPAFPRPIGHNGLNHREDHDISEAQEGMTLRDYFAGQALIGLTLAASIADGALHTADTAGQAAYRFADAMFAERTKR